MQRFKYVILIAGILVLTSGAAYASADGEHALPWGNFAFRVVNIILFLGIICFFWGKKIKAFFTNRTTSIRDEIASLEARKAEAIKQMAEVEERISSLDQEREKILTSYKAQGEALKADIIAQAEKMARQITEQAKTTADNEVGQAIENMRAQIADEIVAAAEKVLTKKLSAAEQAKLVDNYLNKVVLN